MFQTRLFRLRGGHDFFFSLPHVGSPHRFFFALFSLPRFSINIGFLERPLCVGFLWAVITGEWELSLSLAIFFELLWLDLFPAGTYIPPNAVGCLLLTIAATDYFGLRTPEEVAVPALLSLPAAFISARLEYMHRTMQDKAYNRALGWGRGGARRVASGIEEMPPFGMLVWNASLQLLLLQAGFFLAALLVLIGTISGLSSLLGHLPYIQGAEWPALWFVSTVGGVLAVRIPRAYALFAATICLFMFYALGL
ncbi:hypothetical protein [Oleidesulfovibrio alaskensis]|uniref:hypothetical protein n=1 Tax=Oleidesulfovibrio alaskensis TaxID=58180 RepID=UPI0023534955|nr:hypothetical protein [Oleidesulfovibrio alaskensis]